MISVSRNRHLLYILWLGTLLSAFLNLASHSAYASIIDIDESGEAETLVIGPARIKQPLSYAPSSVSRIHHSTIKKLNLTKLLEIFRLLPGVYGHNHDDTTSQIFTYQTSPSSLLNTRIQLMLDGMPLAWASINNISLVRLGILVDDIEWVEFTRSPSLSTYGENAVFGIINIQLKEPHTTQGISTKINYHDNDSHSSSIRYGGQISKTHYRVSISEEFSQSVDRHRFIVTNLTVDEARPDNLVTADKDGIKNTTLSWHSNSQFTPRSSLDLQAKWQSGLITTPLAQPISFYPNGFNHESNNSQFNSRFHHLFSDAHEVMISLSYAKYDNDQNLDACMPNAAFFPELAEIFNRDSELATIFAEFFFDNNVKLPNNIDPDILLLGLTFANRVNNDPTAKQFDRCGKWDQSASDETSRLNLLNTYTLSKSVRLVSALGLVNKSIDMEYFFRGKASSTILQAYSNVEINPQQQFERFTFNLGGFWEKVNNVQSSGEISTKFNVNYQLRDGHTLRLGYARGYKNPNLLENSIDSHIVLIETNPTTNELTTTEFPFFQFKAIDLEQEEIDTVEMSYFINNRNWIMDFRWYRHRIDNSFRDVDISDFQAILPINLAPKDYVRGLELDLGYRHGLSTRTNLALSKTHYANSAYENRIPTDQYTLGAYLYHDFNASVTGSATYSIAYNNSQETLGFPANPLLNLSINKSYYLAEQYHMNAALTLRRFHEKRLTYHDSYLLKTKSSLTLSLALDF